MTGVLLIHHHSLGVCGDLEELLIQTLDLLGSWAFEEEELH